MLLVMTRLVLIRLRNGQQFAFTKRARKKRHTERGPSFAEARNYVYGWITRQVRESRVTLSRRLGPIPATAAPATAPAAATLCSGSRCCICRRRRRTSATTAATIITV